MSRFSQGVKRRSLEAITCFIEMPMFRITPKKFFSRDMVDDLTLINETIERENSNKSASKTIKFFLQRLLEC